MARNNELLSGADPAIGAVLKDVILIGGFHGQRQRERTEIELDELQDLARTLETDVLERAAIPLREPHPATYFGAGTVDALGLRIAELHKPAVLCNDALTPRQQRNLQEQWDVPVLDRTEVILAIFARRATSAEGRLQVEMAQLQHVLPRLAGGWRHLERQRGGVGLRGGPGEKQIEVDRRLINQRLRRLRQRLDVVRRQRQTQRAARTAVPLPAVALVGYTNAGKSTLLNALTTSKVLADDRLFATLDPTSRLLGLPSGKRIIVTDTVGFIQNLPTELVEAFASTLEEVRQASALAIVVDVSHPDCEQQLLTVLQTLESMDCHQSHLLVGSKIDCIDAAELRVTVQALQQIADAPLLPICTPRKTGLKEFKSALETLTSPPPSVTRSALPVIPAASA